MSPREEGENRLFPFGISEKKYNEVSKEDFLTLSSIKGVALIDAMIHPDERANRDFYIGRSADDAFDYAASILSEKEREFFDWFCDHHLKEVRERGVDHAYSAAAEKYNAFVAADYEQDPHGFVGEHHDREHPNPDQDARASMGDHHKHSAAYNAFYHITD